MSSTTVVKENWLTRKPSENAFFITAVLSFILLGLAQMYFLNVWNAEDWMAANAQLVLKDHQIWRAWTTLFAHGDWGHLASNSMLFIPLTYLLSGYYGIWLFPFWGLLLGGLTNFVVLKTLPESVHLIGISGVVYWMAAVWLTLFYLVDSRKSFRRRFAVTLFLTVMLLAPETYKPEVSYLSHFVGYISGVISAFVFYFLNRKRFKAAEVTETIIDDEELIHANDVIATGPTAGES